MKHPRVIYLCFQRLYGKSEIMSIEKTKKAAQECCKTGNLMSGSGQWFYAKYFSEGKLTKSSGLRGKQMDIIDIGGIKCQTGGVKKWV